MSYVDRSRPQGWVNMAWDPRNGWNVERRRMTNRTEPNRTKGRYEAPIRVPESCLTSTVKSCPPWGGGDRWRRIGSGAEEEDPKREIAVSSRSMTPHRQQRRQARPERSPRSLDQRKKAPMISSPTSRRIVGIRYDELYRRFVTCPFAYAPRNICLSVGRSCDQSSCSSARMVFEKKHHHGCSRIRLTTCTPWS
ncbi:hypothetical protein B296_00043258 [Ensete ventricosum]|uniref:Uncharacterized protein n=1 Tax=Ensete ventricosum TaxID=4639 RepID=A0A426ZFD5_ENSVE|nr:hypothetical protein B296_00043258 [Ensete ventricosum]